MFPTWRVKDEDFEQKHVLFYILMFSGKIEAGARLRVARVTLYLPLIYNVVALLVPVAIIVTL